MSEMSKTKHYVNTIAYTQRHVNRMLIPHVDSAKASDFKIALRVELAELISMLPYKWWEQEKSIDQNQVLLEICDIWAFGISFADVDRSDYGYEIRGNFLPIVGELAESLRLQQFDADALIETANCLFTSFNFARLVDLIQYCGVDFRKFYVFHAAKSELNKFRHRQRSFGEYSKQWNGVSDNVVLADIAQDAYDKGYELSVLNAHIKNQLHQKYMELNNV